MRRFRAGHAGHAGHAHVEQNQVWWFLPIRGQSVTAERNRRQ